MQLGELGHRGENENAQASKGNLNQGCLDCEAGRFFAKLPF